MSAERWPAAERTEGEATAAGLTIQVVSGVGFGPTKLAAFDAALREAGIADYNLVYLSSIIPPGSRVVAAAAPVPQAGTWGDRLYVVMAELRVDTRYEEAVAGLGWVQNKRTGQGLFVEHVGHTEREVRRDVLATLDAMCAGRPGTFGAPELVIRNTVCAGEPTCAVVAAVYESAAWNGAGDVIDLR